MLLSTTGRLWSRASTTGPVRSCASRSRARGASGRLARLSELLIREAGPARPAAHEVQTGMGHTGSLFYLPAVRRGARYHEPGQALGNGLPIGAMLTSELAEFSYRHPCLYLGGNPVACRCSGDPAGDARGAVSSIRSRPGAACLRDRLSPGLAPGFLRLPGRGFVKRPWY